MNFLSKLFAIFLKRNYKYFRYAKLIIVHYFGVGFDKINNED